MLKVRNFEKHQHYRHRSPIWIKLYRSLLRDYQFQQLPDAARSHLMMIWLLASELDNQIENDPEWVRRQIGATEPVDLDLLIRAGFLVDAASEVPETNPNLASGVLLNSQNLASGVLLEPQTTLAQSRGRAEAEAEPDSEAEQRQSRGDPLPAPPAAAAAISESHASAFAFAEIEQFVRETKPHIRNPGGLARGLWRTGEEDAAIEQWRARKALPKPENWPKWVFDPREPGTIEEKKRLHRQQCEVRRQAEAEALAFEEQFKQQAAEGSPPTGGSYEA